MNEERENTYDEEYDAIVKRYEDMLKKKKHFFFDVHEFEDIIDYYLDMNEFSNAANAVDHAIKQHPDSSIIKVKWAQILIDEGKPFQALKLLNKIEQVESNNEDLYILKAFAHNLLGNVREAVKQFDLAISVATDDKDELLHNIGVAFQNMLHYKLAIKYLRQAHEMNRGNLQIVYDLAFCHEKNNDFKKAVKYLNRYLDSDPYSEMVWYKMGGIYEKLEDYEKALEAFDFALAIDDEYTLVYLSKASVLVKQGKYREAIKVYREFLEHEDDYVEAYCNIGICYESMKMYDKALEYYQLAIKIDNEYAEAWYDAGNLMINKGKPEESVQYLNKAVELDDENEQYWITLAHVYTNLGAFRGAEKAFNKAIDIDPYVFGYWQDFAELCYKHNRVRQAITLMEDSVEHVTDIPEVDFYLAVFYAKLNHEEVALEHFEKGLKDDYDLHLDILKKFPFLSDNDNFVKLIRKYKGN
jgi:tetratricopeptide (TPR) repeat protein